jgi:hypothetical protein
MTVVSLGAQTAPKAGLELAVSYDATRTNVTTGTNFWMQGGSVAAEGRFYRGLGVVAEVAGLHAANINSSGVDLDMVTATFGPRYTWQIPNRRLQLFGQELLGQANGFHSVFPNVSGAAGSAYALAVQTGGGVSVPLSPRLRVRVLEADWLRTQLPNGTTKVQNSLRLGAGIVWHLK